MAMMCVLSSMFAIALGASHASGDSSCPGVPPKEQLVLVQRQANVKQHSATTSNTTELASSAGVGAESSRNAMPPVATSCYGWSCHVEGQFCPPDAGGSGGQGYCCISYEWTEGTSCVSGPKNNQYGYAHRVNDMASIQDVLTKKGNIELDVGFGGGAWRVTHFDDDHWYDTRQLVSDWLATLKLLLSTGLYDRSFASLWLDIKNPNGGLKSTDDGPGNVADLVAMVRENVPSDVAVIYDIGFKNHFLTDTRGYKQILAMGLNENEGIGNWVDTTAWPGSGNGLPDVQEVFDQLKKDGVERTVIHHGHAFNIDETVLTAINSCQFHQKSDPYRIKKVFTWTNEVSSTMMHFVNPENTYHTDGQIYGSGIREWWTSDGEVEDFDNAIAKYSYSQQKGVRGLQDFWYSSGSDC